MRSIAVPIGANCHNVMATTLRDWQRFLALGRVLLADHPRTLSVRMLRRRIYGLGPDDAKILLAILTSGQE